MGAAGKTMNPSITYKDAGVDIDASNAAKKRIRDLARKTFTPGVLSDIGAFGGMFACDFGGMKNPVLVSSTDGVGTKLKVAVMMNRHNTIGADLVNHCINDIFVQGARPLFFMDYVATGRINPDVIVSVVEGVARGCQEAGCALIGGETAEMPGFYADGEYDVAGFIVGIVDRSRILDGKSIRHGDVLIGLPSVGLHTNGYSLARKLFFEMAKLTPDSRVGDLDGTVGDELLKPHINYEPVLRRAVEKNLIEGLAHITGGGITENLNRILPENCQAEVQLGSWPILPLFRVMARIGNIERDEMLRA
ncbi:MAG TPA: phosphoribosylformylglycinamidine cyclo-ligase, partial [Candidatus Binatia bacterium]